MAYRSYQSPGLGVNQLSISLTSTLEFIIAKGKHRIVVVVSVSYLWFPASVRPVVLIIFLFFLTDSLPHALQCLVMVRST